MFQIYGHVTNSDLSVDPYSIPVHNITKDEKEDPDKYLNPIGQAKTSDPTHPDNQPGNRDRDDEDHEDETTGGINIGRNLALSSSERQEMADVKVVVLVKDKRLNDLFTIVMTGMIIINTVNMGGQLDLDVIREVFKKPIGPAVGFVSQFLLMPLVGSTKRCHLKT